MSSSSSSDGEEPSFRDILSSFAERTSMHGLARVGSTKRFVRAAWLLLVLGYAAWAVYSVIQIFTTYYSYPVSTKVSVRFDENIQFPAVTICNLNPIRRSQYENNDKLRELQEKMKETWRKRFPTTPASNLDSNTTATANNTNRATANNTNTNPATARATTSNTNNVGPAPSNLLDGSRSVGTNSLRPSASLSSWSSFSSSSDFGMNANRFNLSGFLTPPPLELLTLPSLGDTFGFKPPVSQPIDFPDSPPTRARTDPSISAVPAVAPRPLPTQPVSTNVPSSTSEAATPTTSEVPSSTPTTSEVPSSTPTTSEVPSSTPETVSPLSTTEKDFNYEYEDEPDPREGMEETPDFEMEMRTEILTFLDDIPNRNRIPFGHQMSEMLLDCRYQKSHTCYQRNFSTFYNDHFGNCYTFNKKVLAKSVSKPGPIHGVSLILNVQSGEYLPQSQRLGFKVVVHDQKKMPFPQDHGVIVSPGFATNIAMVKTNVVRSAPPYGDCRDYGEEENLKHNMYAMPPYKVGYTDEACQVTCYQRAVVVNCKCCDMDLPCKEKTPALPGNVNLRFCRSDKDNRCQEQVWNDFETGVLDCQDECRPPCHETIFSEEVSMVKWPSTASLEELQLKLRKLPEKIRGHLNITDTNFLRSNLARIDIFYKQLNYQRIETEPTYNWYRLLSDVGGQVSLWLGFSLLTAVELLELILILIRHMLRTMHSTGNRLGKAAFTNNLNQEGVLPTKV